MDVNSFPRNAVLPTPVALTASTAAFGWRPPAMLAMDTAYANYYCLWKEIRSLDKMSEIGLSNMTEAYRTPVFTVSDEAKKWLEKRRQFGNAYPPKVLYETLNVLACQNMTNGKEWSGVKRNNDNVLQKLHNYLRNYHPELAYDFAPRSHTDIEVPSARLGVLYLFSNIRVELKALNVVSGAIDTALDAVVDFDYIETKLDDAKLGFGLSIPNPVSGVELKDVNNFSASQTLNVGVPVVKYAVEKFGNKHLAASYSSSSSLYPSRAISPYKQTDKKADEHSTENIIADFDPEKIETRARRSGGVVAVFSENVIFKEIKTPEFKTNWNWAKNKFSELCTFLLDKYYWARSKFTASNGKTIGAALLKLIISAGLKKLLKFLIANSSGFAGNIVGTVMALGDCFVKGIACVKARRAANKLKISPGHPALIIESLTNAADDEFRDSSIDAALSAMKAVLSTALTVSTVGFGSLITSIVFTITSTVKWVYDTFKLNAEKDAINAFVLKAKAIYENARTLETIKIADGAIQTKAAPKKDGICFNQREFTEFFNEACEISSALPLLALRSGIVGDIFVFVQLFNDRGESLSESTDEESKKYIMQQSAIITQLKSKALAFLLKSGFVFTSANESVTRTLGMALSFITPSAVAPLPYHAPLLRQSRERQIRT